MWGMKERGGLLKTQVTKCSKSAGCGEYCVEFIARVNVGCRYGDVVILC
jgi:hypothetical protein